MKKVLVLTLLMMAPFWVAAQSDSFQVDSLNKPLYEPFIERYILDEIKSLREENQMLRSQVKKQIADARLESSDRAINYTTSTINNIFYIITAAASLLVLLGWRSLNDIKNSLKRDMSKKVETLTADYANRLNEIETKMKERSKVIIETQKNITDTNSIHSLWMRAGIEKSDEDKISIYDEILSINPNDVEAMTYKADTLLEIGEVRWALNLLNTAIEYDDEYSLAYWQRACAYAKLEKPADALKDIEKSLQLSSTLQDELLSEVHFENLRNEPEFKALVA